MAMNFKKIEPGQLRRFGPRDSAIGLYLIISCDDDSFHPDRVVTCLTADGTISWWGTTLVEQDELIQS